MTSDYDGGKLPPLLNYSTIVCCCGLFIFVGMISAIIDFMDKTDVIAAEQYLAAPKDYFNATLLDGGVEYTGSCFQSPWSGNYTVCSVDPSVDAACDGVGGVLSQYVPASVTAAGGRRLSCADSYLRWVKVSFEVGGQVLTRCAYPFGTAANSIEIDWKGWSPKSGLQQVWTLRTADRCAVGFEKLEDFLLIEKYPGGWTYLASLPEAAALAVYVIVLCVGLCCTCAGIAGCYKAAPGVTVALFTCGRCCGLFGHPFAPCGEESSEEDDEEENLPFAEHAAFGQQQSVQMQLMQQQQLARAQLHP